MTRGGGRARGAGGGIIDRVAGDPIVAKGVDSADCSVADSAGS